jgi:hypothetical protein
MSLELVFLAELCLSELTFEYRYLILPTRERRFNFNHENPTALGEQFQSDISIDNNIIDPTGKP